MEMSAARRSRGSFYGSECEQVFIGTAWGSVLDEDRPLLDTLSCDLDRCQYCLTPLQESSSRFREDPSLWFRYEEFSGFCLECGFWRCYRHTTIITSSDESDIWVPYHISRADAIVQRFDITSKEIPVRILRNRLSRRFADIRSINPRALERLIQDIFTDFLDCEVQLTSETRDGGYDLYAIISNEPCLIEVKRRATPTTESVKLIREFFGVLSLNQIRRGIVVSTGERFSKDAHTAAEIASHLPERTVIDLINYDVLESIFLKTRCSPKYFRNVLSSLNWNGYDPFGNNR